MMPEKIAILKSSGSHFFRRQIIRNARIFQYAPSCLIVALIFYVQWLAKLLLVHVLEDTEI